MREYGDVAIGATELACGGLQPSEAWEKAARTIFPYSESLQDKGCPRGAFLGLCEDGRVAGVPAGNYTRSRDNKAYALRAVALLIAEPALANADPKALWERVMNGDPKAYNSQMDVVLALWHRGLLAG
jgi:hypothetical protein